MNNIDFLSAFTRANVLCVCVGAPGKVLDRVSELVSVTFHYQMAIKSILKLG